MDIKADIEAEMKATRQKLEDMTNQINELTEKINGLGDQKQELLQELLRLDGEMRAFKRLITP